MIDPNKPSTPVTKASAQDANTDQAAREAHTEDRLLIKPTDADDRNTEPLEETLLLHRSPAQQQSDELDATQIGPAADAEFEVTLDVPAGSNFDPLGETQHHAPVEDFDPLGETQHHAPIDIEDGSVGLGETKDISPRSDGKRYDPYAKTIIGNLTNRDETATGILTGIINPDDFQLEGDFLDSRTVEEAGSTKASEQDTISLVRDKLANYDLTLDQSATEIATQEGIFKVHGDDVLEKLASLEQKTDTHFADFILDQSKSDKDLAALAEPYDIAFQNLRTSRRENPDFDLGRSPFATMLNMATEILAENRKAPNHYLPVFITLFRKTFKDSPLAKDPEQALEVFKELTRQKLQAKISFAAVEIAKSMSQEDKVKLFQDLVLQERDFANQNAVKAIFEKISLNLDVDSDLVHPNLFENMYKPALTKAVILELGADRLKLIRTLSQIENSDDYKALKKVITVAQTKSKGTSFENIPVLSDFAGEPDFPFQNEKAIAAIKDSQKDLIEALSKDFAVINGVEDEQFKENAALWGIGVIKIIAEQKIDSVYPSIKASLFKNTDFIKALKSGSKKDIQAVLEKFVPEEILTNPLRKYYLAKKFDGDYQIQDALRRTPGALQKLALNSKVRVGSALLSLTGLASLAAIGASDIQANRDPYSQASEFKGITDTGDFSEKAIVDSQETLKARDQWINREVFSFNEAIDALNKGQLSKNPTINAFAAVLAKAPNLKQIREFNPLVISIENDVTKVGDDFQFDLKKLQTDLTRQLDQNTDVLNGMSTNAKQEYIANIIKHFNSTLQSFYKNRRHAPNFMNPISVDDPREAGKKLELMLLNTSYLKDLMVDIDKEDTDLRGEQINHLHEAMSSFARSINAFDLVRETYAQYSSGEVSPNEAAFENSDYIDRVNKPYPAALNIVGRTIDPLRESFGKEALK